MEGKIEKTKKALTGTQSMVVITGAGVSEESGVPTFRGKEGLWRNYDPMELATPEAFARNPKLVWEWYNWRRELIVNCTPNPAHGAIAQLEKQIPHFLLITQNVDGLHSLSGSCKMVEIHGSIWRVRCTKEHLKEWEDRTVPLSPLPPICDCGALLRPAIVWFGEMLPTNALDTIADFFSEHPPEIVIIVGTSSLFPYIQSWALQSKQTGEGLLVEINPDTTPITSVADIVLTDKAGRIMPKFIDI